MTTCEIGKKTNEKYKLIEKETSTIKAKRQCFKCIFMHYVFSIKVV